MPTFYHRWPAKSNPWWMLRESVVAEKHTHFVFIVTELASRCVAHFTVVCGSSGHWAAQQLRNPTPLDEAPR